MGILHQNSIPMENALFTKSDISIGKFLFFVRKIKVTSPWLLTRKDLINFTFCLHGKSKTEKSLPGRQLLPGWGDVNQAECPGWLPTPQPGYLSSSRGWMGEMWRALALNLHWLAWMALVIFIFCLQEESEVDKSLPGGQLAS